MLDKNFVQDCKYFSSFRVFLWMHGLNQIYGEEALSPYVICIQYIGDVQYIGGGGGGGGGD